MLLLVIGINDNAGEGIKYFLKMC